MTESTDGADIIESPTGVAGTTGAEEVGDSIESEFSGVVVGCGSIGDRHLSNLLDLGVEALTAVETDTKRGQRIERQYDVPVTDLDTALARDPDFAVICVPNDRHVSVASAAARAGCDLLVEKPLSDSMAGVEDLLEIVETNDLVTLVGCNMRFHPGIVAIRDLLAADTVGRVLATRIEAGSYLPDWHSDRDYRESYSASREQGGGVVLDYIHELDYARWLFGEVSTVSCFADQVSSLDIETEDIAEILLRFENDVIGEIHLDYVHQPSSRSIQVIGERGTIRWQWANETVQWYTDETGDWRTWHIPQEWSTNDMYVDELRHFLDCLSDGRTTTCDLTDGRAVLELALAAKESAQSGSHITLRNEESKR